MIDVIWRIFEDFSNNQAAALIALVGAIFAAAGLVSSLAAWLTRYGTLILDVLQVPPSRLILLGTAFGLFAAIVGGLPYILLTGDPGSLPGTWPPRPPAFPSDWLDTHSSQATVKLVRTAFFGLFIGCILSLLLTECAMAGFFLSKTEKTAKELRQIAIYVPAAIVAVAVSALKLGGNMSQTGELVAKVMQVVVASLVSGPFDAHAHTFFGTGICRDLAEFTGLSIQATRDPGTGNTICDVGPIRGPYIIACVGIFVSLWMGMIYVHTLARGAAADRIIRRRIIRRILLHACLPVALAIAITGFIEPWHGSAIARSRQELLESFFGTLVVGLVCSMAALTGLALVIRDIRAGVLTAKPSLSRHVDLSPPV
jgi:hypothetical protein